MNRRKLKGLIELVTDEATKLKENATHLEKNRLNFKEFDAVSKERCIYGQMTGYCYSERAYELIRKCAVRIYDTHKTWFNSDTIGYLNGAPSKLKTPENRGEFYHSPIELFVLIMLKHGQKLNWFKNNKILIDYIKGERSDLTFLFPNRKNPLL